MKFSKKEKLHFGLQLIIITICLIAITIKWVDYASGSFQLSFGSQLDKMETSLIRLELRPYKIGGSPEQNEKVHYAWDISHDPEFVYTLEMENGLWTHDRWHDPSKNTRGTDWGWGINDSYHPNIVHDPRFFTDWKWNMEQTYKLYAGGTKFYGRDHTDMAILNFEWKY